jgi:hypothetical protein
MTSLDWKSLDCKNLKQENPQVCLDSRENLDSFQKLISTDQEILISIGLLRPPGLQRPISS